MKSRRTLFISYRRRDTGAQQFVLQLYDYLTGHFHVFLDVDSIEPSDHFPERIDTYLSQTDIFIPIIGPDWLSLLHECANSPQDYVCLEVRYALEQKLTILPILFSAQMPERRELPADISDLSNIHALCIDRNESFGKVAELLVQKLHKCVVERDPYSVALRLIDDARRKGSIHLNLSELKLSDLPSELFELNNLQILQIHANYLTQIPPDIGKLQNLQRLYASHNKISTIPKEIGLLQNLTDLWLLRNNLEVLPREVGYLPKLESLPLLPNPLRDDIWTHYSPYARSESRSDLFEFLSYLRTLPEPDAHKDCAPVDECVEQTLRNADSDRVSEAPFWIRPFLRMKFEWGKRRVQHAEHPGSKSP